MAQVRTDMSSGAAASAGVQMSQQSLNQIVSFNPQDLCQVDSSKVLVPNMTMRGDMSDELLRK